MQNSFSCTSAQEGKISLHWDGRTITGVINLCPNAATVKNVNIDHSASSWVVRLQTEGKDASERPVTIVADGRVENIGAYPRVLRGTWTEGRDKGEFVVTRNYPQPPGRPATLMAERTR